MSESLQKEPSKTVFIYLITFRVDKFYTKQLICYELPSPNKK